MNCLKCGRETPSEQVFCEDCLLDMKKHPVKSGTVVVLPKRNEHVVVKKPPKKRIIPLEEQVKILRKRIKVLTILLMILIVVAAAAIYPAVLYLMEDHFEIGQNYTSISSTTVPTEVSQTTAE